METFDEYDYIITDEYFDDIISLQKSKHYNVFNFIIKEDRFDLQEQFLTVQEQNIREHNEEKRRLFDKNGIKYTMINQDADILTYLLILQI